MLVPSKYSLFFLYTFRFQIVIVTHTLLQGNWDFGGLVSILVRFISEDFWGLGFQ